MASDKTRSTSIMSQILLLLMAAMFLYLVASFANQVTVSRKQKQELDRLDQLLAAELTRQEQLEAALADAHSTRAVEEWAHKNVWAGEDEVVVAIVGGAKTGTQDTEMAPEDAVSGNAPQDAWWDLFFGTP